ncbi:MAG TPA: tetratricopeptide repeat protein [Candidatus Baltobacteraceae bacterium]|nr:tetratricopeptide repeat protein [Candidatus Baltobacteraceae bacterium]
MRRIFGFLAGAVCCFAWTFATAAAANPAGPVTSPTTQGAMDQARERVAGGDLDGALRALASYVAQHPGEMGPERLLGDLYYRHGDLLKAQASYAHILQYAPNDKETHSRLGSVFASENRIDEAISEFNKSLPGTDSVPDLVALHLRKGDFAQYKRDREEMVEEYPGDTEAVLELAQLYESTGQPRLAQQYFQRVLDSEPHQLFALNGIGMSFEDQHAYNDAIIELRLCLLYDSYNYPCWNNLGTAYSDLNQLDLAYKTLEVARNLEPERPEALVNLGNVYDKRGDWKKAVSYYVQATTVDPYMPDAYINLGLEYDDHGLYQLAQSALVKGLAIAPQDGRLHLVLGDTYRLLGQRNDATTQYRQAASQDIYPDYRAIAQRELATLEHVPAPPGNP